MRVKSELALPQVWLSSVKMEPRDPEPKVILNFRTQLTPEVADALACRELVYAGDVPRAFVESMTLEGEERGCEVHMAKDGFSNKVLAKSVAKGKVYFQGTGPELRFQVELEGYAGFAADLSVEIKNDPVTLTIKPAQMDLPITAKAEESEAGGVSDKDVMREMGIGVDDEEESEEK